MTWLQAACIAWAIICPVAVFVVARRRETAKIRRARKALRNYDCESVFFKRAG